MTNFIILIGVLIMGWPLIATGLLHIIKMTMEYPEDKIDIYDTTMQEIDRLEKVTEKKFNISSWIKATVMFWGFLFALIATIATMMFIIFYQDYVKIIHNHILLNFFEQKELGITAVFSAITAVQLMMFSWNSNYVATYGEISKIYLETIRFVGEKRKSLRGF